MSELSADAKQKVLELKQAYISSFADKIQHLDKCWQNIQTSQFAHNELNELRSACHKIAGSAGSYELPDIALAARELELLCKAESLFDNLADNLADNLSDDLANEVEGQAANSELSIKDGYQLLIELMQQLL